MQIKKSNGQIFGAILTSAEKKGSGYGGLKTVR